MTQYMNGKPTPLMTLPEIKIVKITSKGHARIQNHKFDLSEFPDAEKIEREILADMLDRLYVLSSLIELRLQEI